VIAGLLAADVAFAYQQTSIVPATSTIRPGQTRADADNVTAGIPDCGKPAAATGDDPRRSGSDPPERAVVLCVDEKSGIQALDRSRPVLPMMPGVPERRSHDYVRHGTTDLFAASSIADGTVISQLRGHEIGGWRLPDAGDEPRGERRPGKVARPGQLLDCPVVTGVPVDSAQGRTDLRVAAHRPASSVRRPC
jgi:hypothetical protein